MVELRWIKMVLFLILGLQFTGKMQKSTLLQIVLYLITLIFTETVSQALVVETCQL